MAQLALVAMGVGTVLSFKGQMDQAKAVKAQGVAAQQAAEFEAAQLDRIAGQERASSQRQALEERRRASIVASNAIAAAGKGGGGVSDPTISNIIGDIGGEGEYRALVALFEGEERARFAEFQATGRRFEGASALSGAKAESKALKTAAVANLLSGGVSLYDKYNTRKTGAKI